MANHPRRAPGFGHLPGHIRDTFAEALNGYVGSEPGEPLPLVEYEINYRARLISIAEACRLVWNCTDILPGLPYRELQDCLRVPPQEQTYAAAGQALLHELRATGQVNAEADIERRRLYDARDSAYRDLEGWIVARNGGDTTDRLVRGHARVAARNVVEQWHGLRAGRVPAEPLEELAELIVQAEEAIEAAASGAVAAH